MKASRSYVDPEFDSYLEKGKLTIDIEPNVTIATTKVFPEELEDPEEGDQCLFHS
jgi:hypothetical protein